MSDINLIDIIESANSANTPNAYDDAKCEIEALLREGSLSEEQRMIAQKIASATGDLRSFFQDALRQHQNMVRYRRFCQKIEEGVVNENPIIQLFTLRYDCEPSILAARIMEEAMFGDSEAAFIVRMYSLSDEEETAMMNRTFTVQIVPESEL